MLLYTSVSSSMQGVKWFLEINYKTMQSGDLISSDCSNMIRSVLIWSAHTLFCLNSAWFSRSLESTAAPSRCRIITLIGASFLYNQHKYSVFPFGGFTRCPFLKVSSSMMVLPLSPKYYRRSHIRSLPPFLCLLWGPVAGT